MRRFATFLFIFLAALLAFGGGARAQFPQQNATVQSAGGSANAQTGTMNNIVSYDDLINVYITLYPSVTNTSAATLNLNGLGAIPVVRSSNGFGLLALTGGELSATQATILMYDGSHFIIQSAIGAFATAANLAASSLSFGVPTNLQLSVTVGSNNLAINFCTISGSSVCNAASTSNPVWFAFRDATAANGDPAIVKLSSSLGFTIQSGNTMGCSNGVTCRLWLFAANNAGNVAICAFNAFNGTSLIGPYEYDLINSQSGTNGGSTAQLFYCSASALSGVAIRYVGFIDITESTAGTWASGPSTVQLFGPGIKRPGDVINVFRVDAISASTSCQTSNTSTSVTATIILGSAANLVRARADVGFNIGASHHGNVQISRGSGPTLIGTTALVGNSNAQAITVQVPASAFDQPNATSQAYTVYCSSDINNGATVNGATGNSDIELEEIQGFLEPANDNLFDRPRMVG